MLRGKFRPWGPLHWLLQKLSASRWGVLGCLGPEDRSLEAWLHLKGNGFLKRACLFEVHDEHTHDARHSRFYERTERRLAEMKDRYLSAGGVESELIVCYLGDIYGRYIEAVDSFLERSGRNVIVDISSLPKRIFFPVIRRLLQSQKVRTLIAAYTVPLRYAEDELAEDAQLWTYLPTFAPPEDEPNGKLLIVALGYEPLGIVHEAEGKGLHLLFPFPSLPPGIKRNWDFVFELRGTKPEFIQRVHIYDVPETFDRIRAITNEGQRYSILAPYGPKPTSLAMCLFAVAADSVVKPPSVFYTQPRVYNPDYSKGVALADGRSLIMSYCLRLQGQDLYGIGS